MNRVKSVLEEIRVDKQVKEYDTLKDLLEAYVNDGITHGRYFNVLVFGETLYIDKGNDNMGNLFYYQQAIRLSDDIYVLNNNPADDHHNTRDIFSDIIIKHIRAHYWGTSLPTLHKKIPNGVMRPPILKAIISETKGIDKRMHTTLKLYGRDRMHEEVIENYKYLVSTHQAMTIPGNVELSNGIIRDMIGALKKVQKVHVRLSEYLDVLRQLPEKPAP